MHRDIDDTQSASNFVSNLHSSGMGTQKCTFKEKKSHQSGVKFKIKKRMNVPKMKNVGLSKGTPKQRLKKPCEDTDGGVLNSAVVEIVTGKGLSVPVCSGEEVVSIKSYFSF